MQTADRALGTQFICKEARRNVVEQEDGPILYSLNPPGTCVALVVVGGPDPPLWHAAANKM